MRFFIALLFSIHCFAGMDKQLISTPEGEIGQGLSLDNWLDDFVEAKKQAKEENKALLVAFLGPNWCSWSDKLEEEVLAREEFIDALKKEVVFVKVEIPEDFEKSSFPGDELRSEYRVDECPALILVESSGNPIAKLNYLPIKGSDLASYIHQTLSDYRRIATLETSELKQMKVDELQYLYTHAGRLADETFKKALLKQGLKVDRGSYFLLEEYGDMVSKSGYEGARLSRLRHKILARDPQNAHGCIRKLAVLDFEALSDQKRELNVSSVVQPLVDYLAKFGDKDLENAWELEMKIAKYCYTHDQIHEALKHAQASLQRAPDSAKKDIAQSIEFLKTRVN